jgi:hypothetical protein
VVEVPLGTSGARYTLVAALGLKGVQVPVLFEGAMTMLLSVPDCEAIRRLSNDNDWALSPNEA